MSYYSFVVILQVFCFYHAYTHKTDYKWFILIFIVPLIGSLIYLYVHFYSRRNIEVLSDNLKSAVDPDHQLKKLQKQNKHTGTIANKKQLAAQYFDKAKYSDALELYQSCLVGYNENDQDALCQVLLCHFNLNKYDEAIETAKKINNEPIFALSEAKIAFAWSLNYVGKVESAADIFKEMDHSFSNYVHRLEYSKFLLENEGKFSAVAKLDELIDEIDDMDAYERRLKRSIIKTIKQFRKSLN